MRKHFSVLMLIVRSTIYKILVLFFLTACAEWLLFRLSLNFALTSADAGIGMAALENIILSSRISWVYAICFVIMAALLCTTGCEYRSKQGYTLRRLSVSELSVFAWQGGYNIFCFFMLWVFQALLSYALCTLYITKADPTLTSSQTIFLAFYRNDFLHSLLPLSEVSRWIRNILLAMCLGLAAAHFSHQQRRGKVGVTMIAMTALSLVFFSRGIASLGNDILIILLSIANAAAIIRNVFGRGTDEEA